MTPYVLIQGGVFHEIAGDLENQYSPVLRKKITAQLMKNENDKHEKEEGVVTARLLHFLKGKHMIRTIASAFVFGALGIASAFATPPHFDPSFGNLGKVTIAVDQRTVSYGGLIVQPDLAPPEFGKIVIGTTVTSETNASYWMVTRLNMDGTLDSRFGNNGVVSLAVNPSMTKMTSLALAPDGGYFLAGPGCDAANCLIPPMPQSPSIQPIGQASTANQIAIVKLTKTGSLDATFGNNGRFTEAASGVNRVDLVVQTSGKVVIVVKTTTPALFTNPETVFMERIGTDGLRDTAFPKQVLSSFSNGNGFYTGMSQGVNGTIVMGSGRSGELVRFTADGVLEATLPSVFGLPAASLPIGVGADGKIGFISQTIPCTPFGPPCAPEWYFTQINADGSLDPGFGKMLLDRVPQAGSRNGDGSFSLAGANASNIALREILPTTGQSGPPTVVDYVLPLGPYLSGFIVKALPSNDFSHTRDPFGPAMFVIGEAGGKVMILRYTEVETKDRLSGIWWNPAESGRGLTVLRNYDGITFAVFYAYDKNGRATWYYMPRGEPVGLNAVEGDVYHSTGPSYSQPVFDPALVNPGPPVGRFRLDWNDASANARFSYSIDGISAVSNITPFLSQSQSDGVRWDPRESGWGFASYSGTLLPATTPPAYTDFAVWITYDDLGATWFVMPSVVTTEILLSYRVNGNVYNPVGPPLAITFDPAKVKVGDPVGSFQYVVVERNFVFGFDFSINGVKGTKSLTPFSF